MPAHDRHEVVAVHGDRCWVAHCGERGALQFAHREAARFAGSSRAYNMMLFCLTHHRGFDSGTWKLRQGREGPIIVDRRGQVVGRLRRPGEAPPEWPPPS
jgi:predicted restriction endonuclease